MATGGEEHPGDKQTLGNDYSLTVNSEKSTVLENSTQTSRADDIGTDALPRSLSDEEVLAHNPAYPRDSNGRLLQPESLIDIVIVYAQEDYEDVVNGFIPWLKSVLLRKKDLREISIKLWSSEIFTPSNVYKLDDIVNRCMRILLFLTPNFPEDINLQLFVESGIYETRLQYCSDSTPLGIELTKMRKFSVRPIHTEKEKTRKNKYVTPTGVGAVQGIDYFAKDRAYVEQQAINLAKHARDDHIKLSTLMSHTKKSRRNTKILGQSDLNNQCRVGEDQLGGHSNDPGQLLLHSPVQETVIYTNQSAENYSDDRRHTGTPILESTETESSIQRPSFHSSSSLQSSSLEQDYASSEFDKENSKRNEVPNRVPSPSKINIKGNDDKSGHTDTGNLFGVFSSAAFGGGLAKSAPCVEESKNGPDNNAGDRKKVDQTNSDISIELSSVPSLQPGQGPSSVPSLQPGQGPLSASNPQPELLPSIELDTQTGQRSSSLPNQQLGQGPSSLPNQQLGQGPSSLLNQQLGQGSSSLPNQQLGQGPSSVPNPQLVQGTSRAPNSQLEQGPLSPYNQQLGQGPSSVPNPQQAQGPSSVPNPQQPQGPSVVPNPQPTHLPSVVLDNKAGQGPLSVSIPQPMQGPSSVLRTPAGQGTPNALDTQMQKEQVSLDSNKEVEIPDSVSNAFYHNTSSIRTCVVVSGMRQTLHSSSSFEARLSQQFCNQSSDHVTLEEGSDNEVD